MPLIFHSLTSLLRQAATWCSQRVRKQVGYFSKTMGHTSDSTKVVLAAAFWKGPRMGSGTTRTCRSSCRRQSCLRNSRCYRSSMWAPGPAPQALGLPSGPCLRPPLAPAFQSEFATLPLRSASCSPDSAVAASGGSVQFAPKFAWFQA